MSETTRNRALLVVVGLLAMVQVAVGVVTLVTRSEQADYERCAARYDQEFGEAYLARVEPSAEASDALYAFLRTAPPVLGPDPSPGDVRAFRASLSDYLALYRDQVEARRENPYPPLPDALCGRP